MLVTFLRRVTGAAMLDGGTYEEVEADRRATPQAFAVVMLSSLAVTPMPIAASALAFAWTMAASVVAVRQALDFSSTRRAIAVCLVGWALPLAIAATLAVTVAGG